MNRRIDLFWPRAMARQCRWHALTKASMSPCNCLTVIKSNKAPLIKPCTIENNASSLTCEAMLSKAWHQLLDLPLNAHTDGPGYCGPPLPAKLFPSASGRVDCARSQVTRLDRVP